MKRSIRLLLSVSASGLLAGTALAPAWSNVVTVQGTAAASAPPAQAEPQRKETGPRLTDAELLDALDLRFPGLETAAQAAAAQEPEKALSELARFLRQRHEPFDFGQKRPRHPNYNRAPADEVLQHQFTVGGIPHRFEGAIDWSFNPTTVTGSAYAADHEWTWQFNRHGDWSTLAAAYAATGDEKYTREFADELKSWLRDCPVPQGKAWQGPTSPWRTIECGIRTAGSWATAFTVFRSAPAVSDRLLLDWLKSWIEHGRYLHAHPTGRNWLTMEMNGLYHIGTLIPFAKEATSWRQDAAQRLRKELDVQVYPDGAQDELSPGYHNVALRNMLGIPRLASTYGHTLPPDYVASLEKMFAYNLWAMTPNRSLPHWNDSWDVDVPDLLAEGASLFPHRRDFLWVATDGQQGVPPDHLSHLFPWAGQVVLRSGWDRNALYLGFEVGPFGTGHQHEDKLGLVLFAFGRALLVEGGSYAYDASKWRRYVLGSAAHNVVLVDGAGQNRGARRETRLATQPQEFGFKTTDRFDCARGVYEDGFGGGIQARHVREVLFPKPEGVFIVRDQLDAPDDRDHLFEALWHLDAPALLEQPSDGIYETRHDHGPNLRVIAQADEGLRCRVVKGQEEPVVQGWIPLEHGRRGVRPIPCLIHARTGRTVQFLTVLQPLRSAEAARVRAVSRRNGQVVLTWDDGRETAIQWP